MLMMCWLFGILFVSSRGFECDWFMKRLLYMVCAWLVAVVAVAQMPEGNPTVEYVEKESSELKTVYAGESFSEEAPLHLDCRANMTNVGDFQCIYEWRLSRIVSGQENLLVRREDADTSFDVSETGTYSLRFAYTYVINGVSVDVDDIEPVTFTVPESALTCPDGFSPNGDDRNDYLLVTCKSIVKLQAQIFNRWGQRVAQCSLAEAQAHVQSAEGRLCIWDGRIGGRLAKDGVYFLNLVAEGSDGVVYKVKKAINVLKGFTDDEETEGR